MPTSRRAVEPLNRYNRRGTDACRSRKVHPSSGHFFDQCRTRSDLDAFEPDAGMTGSVTDDGVVGLLTMVTRGAVAGVAGDEPSAKNRVRRIR